MKQSLRPRASSFRLEVCDAFYRTANRLNQYYKTATGQRVAKRINDGDFPYNIYDATGRIVKPETKKAKKKA